MNKRTPFLLLGLITFLILLMGFWVSCGSGYTPKPRGYMRIDLPGKEYQLFDSVFPYSFEYPVYARLEKDPMVHDSLMYKRLNLQFPQLKGTLHLTYEPLSHNLDPLIEDAVDFVYKHVPKASIITKTTIDRKEDKVFGTVFHIKGKEAASTYQFFATDSVYHFLRGALYLNTYTDNDSLKPVVEFLQSDVDRILQTLTWK